VQGYLARGDRRAADVIEAVMENGGDYRAALRSTGTDVSGCLYRMREQDEVLPWDHVDARVTKTYLWREYTRAMRGELTGPCKLDECTACGACTPLDDDM
jgi:hypothetical protein